MDKKKNYIFIGLILTVILISVCIQISESPDDSKIEYSIPEPPDLHGPEPIYLPEKLESRCTGRTIAIIFDTDSARFENCTVTVRTSGVKITRSEFINSRIFFESASDIVFADNIVRDYPIYEKPAISVYDSEEIIFRHNCIKNNSIGVSVAESQNITFENNIFDNNYQHNAIAMYKSSGEVSGNLFKYNFPHGILVHFIPKYGAVNIHDNIFFMNVEDAINFEDWANAKDESRIYNNIITKTAWAGINIEYNSWNANILIENNYISESGYTIEKFPNPSEWSNGWKHGIKLEDCSGIIVKNNTILDNNENGIDIRNCKNVTLQKNTVTRNDIGIFVGGPSPYSFTREISPLSRENAGPSIVIFKDNYVFKNNENIVEEKVTKGDVFNMWWEVYKKPISFDSSSYPDFLRGAWASRIDEMRSYLINAEKLRDAGFDTVMLGPDIVFDPETGEAKSLGDEIFVFYLQAFKKAGFRIVLIPNPMHPNLDMGKGYEWEEPDPNAGYHRSYKLIKKLDPVVVKWAKIAEKYNVDAFVPINEPYKFVWDYNDVSKWLQEILPEIKKVYTGKVIALDTMYDLGSGKSIPYPYDYSGYDMILGGPPCGWKEIDCWEEMIKNYIQKGNEYVQIYGLEGFGLYEWGGYTGGVWYEPIPEDQILTEKEAEEILKRGVKQANDKVIASFPRISQGWVDFDTPSLSVLKNWYLSMGESIIPLDDKKWSYDELIEIEEKLAGSDYENIFMIET